MSTDSLYCPICHFGVLHVRDVTYTRVFEGRLIVIPNVSALVCDVCGERVIDNEVLSRLSGLLGPYEQDIRHLTRRI